MRRRLLISSLLALFLPSAAVAQEPAPEPVEPAAAQAAPGEPAPEPLEEPAEPEPPPAPPPGLPAVELPAVGPALPNPEDADTKLEQASPPPPVEKKWWRAPETMFHLHGYFRMRGTLLKGGDLGHSGLFDRLPGTLESPRLNYDPFIFFSPADSTRVYALRGNDVSPQSNTDVEAPLPVAGGCGDHPSASAQGAGRCDKKLQVTGDMRLRLKPEVHLSDDVRVKAWIDVMDNVGLGTLGYGPNNFEPTDIIRVRRVWGEARNRDIGELRFGRMGRDWGLGILDNGGDRYGIDSDFSSDADRIMAISNLAGFYLMAAYDWATQGYVTPGTATPSGVPIDRAQRDDGHVVTLAAAHRLEPDLQESALLRGEAVFNYGAYFVWRNQFLRWNKGYTDALSAEGLSGVTSNEHLFDRVNQKQYIPDLWLQFLWEGLRIELEAAFVAGSLEGGCPKLIQGGGDKGPNRDATEVLARFGGADQQLRANNGQCKFRQLGVALESEYRLFDDRLGIYFMSGLATGDSNSYGLAYTNDPAFQRVDSGTAGGNRTISTYQFHPDYRVDLILWRTIMRRVAGGYYFKPGISYDFIHDAYGQRAGGRLDLIYSRATNPAQTWGDSGNLGLEADLSLYYRSQDGPDPFDGFYGMVQAAVLFPFQGLDYVKSLTAAPSSDTAFMMRGVVGIAF